MKIVFDQVVQNSFYSRYVRNTPEYLEFHLFRKGREIILKGRRMGKRERMTKREIQCQRLPPASLFSSLFRLDVRPFSLQLSLIFILPLFIPFELPTFFLHQISMTENTRGINFCVTSTFFLVHLTLWILSYVCHSHLPENQIQS